MCVGAVGVTFFGAGSLPWFQPLTPPAWIPSIQRQSHPTSGVPAPRQRLWSLEALSPVVPSCSAPRVTRQGASTAL